MAVAVIGLLYLWRVDFQRYSVFTTGTFKKVYRYQATDQTAECSANHCESGCLEGEIRKATKEVVIFGCPIIRQTTAVNRYCPDHTSFEFQQGEYGVTTTERVKESVVSGVISLSAVRFEPESESGFSGIKRSTGDAFDLVGIAFIVVIVAIAATVVQGLGANHDR